MMNLKPNLWTLLFITALAVLAYTYLGQEAPSTPVVEIPVSDQDSISLGKYEIDPNSFESMRSQFLFVRNYIYNDVSNLIPDPAPSYYRIEWDELDELYDQQPADYLYIIPIVENFKKPDGSCSKAVSLAFSKVEPNFGGPTQFGNDLVYNFATPCPPLCDDERDALAVICKE